MRVAIIHYWLVSMRGGERVLEQLLHLFPDADIYTHVYVPENVSDVIRDRTVTETFIARLPGGRKHYQKYLGLMPRALEELDLSGYDLILSSGSGPAKGIIAPPDVPHICYCHSPMRYIWDQYHDYRDGLGFIGRMVFSRVASRMRIWDVASANRVDRFVANSNFVKSRIWRCWRREASVVHPPVDLTTFAPTPSPGEGAPYLFLSELVPYKRADLAIEACRRLGRKLRIVGSGSELARLKRSAPSGVEFLGRVTDEEIADVYRTSRALIFPGVEDFGIVPLEAMASGRPVIAYGRGGALDTVIDGRTGVLFDGQTPEALAEAMLRFETHVEAGLHAEDLARHVETFSPERFRKRMLEEIGEVAPAVLR